MKEDIVKDAIGRSFLIILPSGWFGRPWDSMFSLDSVSQNDDRLQVEMSNGVAFDCHRTTQVFGLIGSIFFIVKDMNFSSKTVKSTFPSGVILLLQGGLNEEQKVFKIYEKLNELVRQS